MTSSASVSSRTIPKKKPSKRAQSGAPARLPSHVTDTFAAQEEMFRQAYDEFSDAIFRHCYFRVFEREKGKDLMQETFMRAWKYLLEGKQVDNMRAFLYKIANNLIIDEARKKKETSLDALKKKGWDPSYDETSDMQQRIDEGNILQALFHMDGDYRDILIMRYVDGLHPAEIAELTGKTPNTVSVQIHRGIKQLKTHLRKS